jgi:hypothetical protein
LGDLFVRETLNANLNTAKLECFLNTAAVCKRLIKGL